MAISFLAQRRWFLISGIVMMSGSMHAVDISQLSKALDVKNTHPFNYNLGVEIIPSARAQAGVTICCHGYGGDNRIIDAVKSFNAIPDHLVSFNFPDYDLMNRSYDPAGSSFGSIKELLPLLYIIKRCVCDGGLQSINLYGFSAGGGAVVNALVVLNTSRYDAQLAQIGITPADKKQMIAALERGHIVLDCPLKSIEEIIEMRGKSPEFFLLAEHFRANAMRPIDTVQLLKGLRLNVLVHFQKPDQIIGNKEDQLFIDRLRAANAGVTEAIIGRDGGHNVYHASLWKRYAAFRQHVLSS